MAAADAPWAALERDPYDEAALRVLLRAYVIGGRVAAALAAYASARERMADQLGTDPSPETAALHTAILRGDLVAPARPPARPPAGAAMGLVGRDNKLAYLEAVAARARGGSVEVVVVDGEKQALGRRRCCARAAGRSADHRGRHGAQRRVRAAGPGPAARTRSGPRWPRGCASSGPS